MRIQNSRYKLTKTVLLVTGYWLLVTGLFGCASVPKRAGLPSYNIHGATYLSLLALCDLQGISWNYDAVTRVVSLNKNSHQIKFMVGDDTVYVDGAPRQLNRPVEIYDGAIAIPDKFREQVLDILSRGERLPAVSIYPSQAIKKVIIDAGHGGKDPGAIGRTGLKEKLVNLDIAKRLQALLEAQGFKVIMTRSQDRFISLGERVRITNRSGADLFISIHSNASRVRNLSGLEMYCISPEISDLQRALASAKNNEVLNLDHDSVSSPSESLKAILWDMTYNFNRAESIELSRAICKPVKANLDTRLIGIKSARYQVLRGASIPAVLIEVGFLSNPAEECLLSKADYRQKIAETISQGLLDYGRAIALTKQPKADSLNLTKTER